MIESVARDNRGYRSSVVEVENFIIAAVSRDNRGYRSNSVGADALVRPLTKAYTLVISSEAEKSLTKETARRISAPAKCQQRLAAEKSPAKETKPNVHDYPQTLASGGSPPRNPLREKREQSYTTIPNTCPQGFPAAPAHSPAGAHRTCTRLWTNAACTR